MEKWVSLWNMTNKLHNYHWAYSCRSFLVISPFQSTLNWGLSSNLLFSRIRTACLLWQMLCFANDVIYLPWGREDERRRDPGNQVVCMAAWGGGCIHHQSVLMMEILWSDDVLKYSRLFLLSSGKKPSEQGRSPLEKVSGSLPFDQIFLGLKFRVSHVANGNGWTVI